MRRCKLDLTDHKTLDDLCRYMRSIVMERLLYGNDAVCFTTAQYREAYVKKWPPPEKRPDLAIPIEVARMHLETIGIMREAAPDVWTPTDEYVKWKAWKTRKDRDS